MSGSSDVSHIMFFERLTFNCQETNKKHINKNTDLQQNYKIDSTQTNGKIKSANTSHI